MYSLVNAEVCWNIFALISVEANIVLLFISSSVNTSSRGSNKTRSEVHVYVLIPAFVVRRPSLSLSPSARRSASLTRSFWEPMASTPRTWARRSTATSSTRRRCTMTTSFTSPTLKTAKRSVYIKCALQASICRCYFYFHAGNKQWDSTCVAQIKLRLQAH